MTSHRAVTTRPVSLVLAGRYFAVPRFENGNFVDQTLEAGKYKDRLFDRSFQQRECDLKIDRDSGSNDRLMIPPGIAMASFLCINLMFQKDDSRHEKFLVEHQQSIDGDRSKNHRSQNAIHWNSRGQQRMQFATALQQNQNGHHGNDRDCRSRPVQE